MLEPVNSIGSSGAYGGRLSAATVGAGFEQSGSIKAATPSEAISPRIKADPVAGVIVQFLDSKGEVQVQTPSVATVAYLKAGLTSEGGVRSETQLPSVDAEAAAAEIEVTA
ncbi:MAG: hypothetical protein GC131_06145 [Alphaproteobacteria bacterium]|nr:hypothetical protein [Alphaproteobacteria bacterium]